MTSRTPGARPWALFALALTLCLGLFTVLPGALSAQGGNPQGLAGQNLRGYTHMFIAYFVCWVIVLGWAISIFRRLGKVERALKG